MLGVHTHDVAILVRDAANAASDECTALECGPIDAVAEIRSTHDRLGHRLTQNRIQRRLANGLQFLRFDVDGQPVASTWVAGEGGRYIDELSWLLPMERGELWVRDVFVAPAWRGRRLFSEIARALSTLAGPGPRRIWSDVDYVNEQSMRAHRLAGFDLVARVRALDLAGRVRWRSALPDWSPEVREIDPNSRWIWLRGDKLRRHEELIA